MLAKVLALGLALQAVFGSPVEDRPFDFSQHKLIRIQPKNDQNLKTLEELHKKFDMKVDYWNHPMPDMRPILSLISPDGMDFLKALNASNIKYEITANNFQKQIDAEREQNEHNRALFKRDGNTKAYDYETVYHTYDEVKAELKAVAAANSGVAKYLAAGTTYQGREIPGIILTSGSGTKQSLILECGIHSREWITTAACMWIVNKLVTDASLSSYLTKYEWVILPTVNSDGYVYTWTTNRMWRKTRTPYSSCYGADPNRNWDAAHCQTGASTNPCSDTYCGPKPFSEPCAKAVADLVTARKGKIAAYFAIHSYSQLWMYPYGYSNAKPSNAAQLADLSAAALSAIKATNGLTFTAGTIASTIYVASGSSIDWAYDKADVKIAFALELRDTGKYGFQLPPAQIKDGSTETWAGIKAVVDKL